MKEFPITKIKDDRFYDTFWFEIRQSLIGEVVISKGDSKKLITFNKINNLDLCMISMVNNINDIIKYINKIK